MKTLFRLLPMVLIALVMVAFCGVEALAQAAADDNKSFVAEKPAVSLSTRYAIVYGLVLLGIALGFTNVVRPGKRKGEKPRPT